MIDDLNLTFLAGGFHRCDTAWNRKTAGLGTPSTIVNPLDPLGHADLPGS